MIWGEMASFWTPEVWEWKPKPASIDVALEHDDNDWTAGLHIAGYECRFATPQLDDDRSGHEVQVWLHYRRLDLSTRHLFVEVSDSGGTLTAFLVDDHYIAAFFIDKLPQILATQRLLRPGLG